MDVEFLNNDAKFLEDIRSIDRILRSLKNPPQWTVEGSKSIILEENEG